MEEKIKEEKRRLKTKERKRITILGISLWRLFAYFLIYSVVGYIIETIFGILTKGVIESRQSFLYGPFCSIYAIGAVIMIIFLQYFKKNNFTLFFAGYVTGSVVEYVLSFIGQATFNIRWWDYSGEPFNLNGRICASYSLFWGILAIFLITYFNPKIDILINLIKEKFKLKTLKIITAFGIVFLLINFLITCFALKMFFARLVLNHDLKIENGQKYVAEYEKFYQNEIVKNFSEKHFSDEKILKTFPNLKTIGEERKYYLY